MFAAVTTTLHWAVITLPSVLRVFAIIVAVPTETPVTSPSTTVATSSLSVVHVSSLFLTVEGTNLTVNDFFSPTCKGRVFSISIKLGLSAYGFVGVTGSTGSVLPGSVCPGVDGVVSVPVWVPELSPESEDSVVSVAAFKKSTTPSKSAQLLNASAVNGNKILKSLLFINFASLVARYYNIIRN